MNIPWGDCQIFIAVAETKSFSAAARRLKLTQPTISRRIAALEAHVGRPLFRRDRSGAHLTTEGHNLLAPAEQMARWAAEMERSTSGWEQKPHGLVTIAAPPGLAFEFLVPFAAEVQNAHDDLRIDLVTGVETMDLTRGQAELSIRTRAPNQKELTVLATCSFELGVFVSPELNEKLAKLKHKGQEIPWITWAYPMEHVAPRPQLESAFQPFTIGFASNDYLAQQRAAECGMGAIISAKVEHRFSPWNNLVEIDVDIPLSKTQSFYIVCARSMKEVPRVRAVTEYLCAELAHAKGATLQTHIH